MAQKWPNKFKRRYGGDDTSPSHQIGLFYNIKTFLNRLFFFTTLLTLKLCYLSHLKVKNKPKIPQVHITHKSEPNTKRETERDYSSPKERIRVPKL